MKGIAQVCAHHLDPQQPQVKKKKECVHQLLKDSQSIKLPEELADDTWL
jgi:hypothetical protein